MNENAMSFQVGKTIKAIKEAEFEYDLYLNQRGNILIRAVAKIISTMCLLCSVAQLCVTLQPHEILPTRLLCPWDFPGKNTGIVISFSRGYAY